MTSPKTNPIIETIEANLEEICNSIKLAINQGVEKLIADEDWCGLREVVDTLDTHLVSGDESYTISYILDLTSKFS